MIEARPWRRFARWFAGHAQSRLLRSFEAVHVRGLGQLRSLSAQRPLLLVANHTSWWDAMVVLWLSLRKVEGCRPFGMMDAANLRRLRFFRWAGVFGIDLTSRRDGARTVRYAASLLAGAGDLVWVFPQGEERPVDEPLRFKVGATAIASHAEGAVVVPVALRYVFAGDERPHVYVSIGGALAPPGGEGRDGVRRARDAQQDAVAAQLQCIARAVSVGDDEFETVLARAPAGSDWATVLLDAVAGLVQRWGPESHKHLVKRPVALPEPQRPNLPRGAKPAATTELQRP